MSDIQMRSGTPLLVYTLLVRLIRFLLRLCPTSLLPEKVSRSVELRGIRLPKNSQPATHWFHASSGEIEYLLPLAREIKNKDPESVILLTFFSASVEKRVEALSSDFDLILPMPWDTPENWKVFFRDQFPSVRPLWLAIARTDFWPNMISACHQARIPVHLVSVTWSETKSHSHWAIRPLVHNLLTQVDRIFLVDQKDRDRLLSQFPALPPDKALVVGDTRWDQMSFRAKNLRQLDPILRLRSHKPLFVWASVWPEDIEVLLKAAPEVFEQYQIWAVPHEVSWGAKLFDLVAKDRPDTTVALWSNGASNKMENEPKSNRSHNRALSDLPDLVVLDELGWLITLYSVADLVFVGGSFKRQVHSVLEPLSFGLPVLVGPFHKNSREAIDFRSVMAFGSTPAVQVVDSPESLSQAASLSLCSRQSDRSALLAQLALKVGATRLVFEAIKHHSQLSIQ